MPVLAFTQHAVVISYRRFGTIYRFHLQGLIIQELHNSPEEYSSRLLRDLSLKTQQTLFAWRSGRRRRYIDSLRDGKFGESNVSNTNSDAVTGNATGEPPLCVKASNSRLFTYLFIQLFVLIWSAS